MKMSKLARKTHKWLGIVLSIILCNISVTGLLLLEKKEFEWIQPSTCTGTEGTINDFITMQKVFDVAFAQGYESFQDLECIDRVDFRPDERVFKVRSRKNYMEMQIDAVSGAVLNISTRRSDLYENLHDGSFFGQIMHGKLMPIVAVANLTLIATGFYLWLSPKLKRKKTKNILSK
ncbi:MAG: PepSY domain-containing protein [Planctomycetes bacterium]|nr:PepSY domain-containing protein [Planctomycetota bacterium]